MTALNIFTTLTNDTSFNVEYVQTSFSEGGTLNAPTQTSLGTFQAAQIVINTDAPIGSTPNILMQMQWQVSTGGFPINFWLMWDNTRGFYADFGPGNESTATVSDGVTTVVPSEGGPLSLTYSGDLQLTDDQLLGTAYIQVDVQPAVEGGPGTPMSDQGGAGATGGGGSGGGSEGVPHGHAHE